MVVGSNPKADDFWNSFLQQDDFGTGVIGSASGVLGSAVRLWTQYFNENRNPPLRKYVLNMQFDDATTWDEATVHNVASSLLYRLEDGDG